jgi:predicted nuclease of restriction endonuclease-like (RecB) superfamily
LLSVEDPAARDWYMHEAADQRWSTRQLERQISVLYYERLLASRRKTPVRKEARGSSRFGRLTSTDAKRYGTIAGRGRIDGRLGAPRA